MAKYSAKLWLLGAVLVAVMGLFIRLGFWQLERAELKRGMLESQAQRSAMTPLQSLPATDQWESQRYRRIAVSGTYDATRQVLLDNQTRQGRAGYFVLTPLQVAGSGCRVLVNRGWVPAAPTRAELPKVDLAETQVRVEGVVERFPSVGLSLAGAEALSAGWPVVAQQLDAAVLAERLGYCLAPYQLWLAAEIPQGYVRDWQMQRIDPDKSLGYAFQWFAMALGLALYSGWRLWRGAGQPDTHSNPNTDRT